MERFLKFFFAFFLMTLFSSAEGMASEPSFKTPDFAYPQNVIKDANDILVRAAAESSPAAGVMRLRAMLELCAAEREIDSDSLFAQPAKIEKQIAACADDDTAAKAMLTLFEAQVYKDIYSRSPYKYNRVDAPLTPLPEDISEWSGNQFRAKITDLLAKAQLLAGSTELVRFKDCLDYSSEALQYLPTVRDFVLRQSAQILSSIAYGTVNYNKEILDLCREGITASTPGSAPWFFWQVKDITDGSKDISARQQALYSLYTKYAKEEPARYVLGQLCKENYESGPFPSYVEYAEEEPEEDSQTSGSESDKYARRDRMIELLRASLAAFPSWYGNNELKNKLIGLTHPWARVQAPSMIAPGKDFDVNVESSFVRTLTVSLHLLPAGQNRFNAEAIAKRTPVVMKSEIACKANDEKNTVRFSVPNPGLYAVVTAVDGKYGSGTAVVIEATPIMGMAATCGPDGAAMAVDFITGKPVRSVIVSKSNRRNVLSFLGKTDGDGILRFDVPSDGSYGNRLVYKYQGRSYDFSRSLGIGSYTPTSPEEQGSAVVFTDRSIYHPGDTVRWAVAVAAGMDRKSARTLENVEVTLEFHDPNAQLTDSVIVRTDAYGRATGSFATKKGVLTGLYNISASFVKDGKRFGGWQSVMVSDFKAPEIQAEVTSVLRDVPSKGSVTVEGRATTYSGMPVHDAAVSADVKGASRWRWFVPEVSVGTIDAVTDASGNFKIEIPAGMLATEINGKVYSNFSVAITVTSRTAETAETKADFTTGKPYVIVADVPSDFNSDNEFVFTPRAFEAGGKKVPVALKWYFVNSDKKAEGPAGGAVAGTPVKVNLANLASGTYRIVIEPADTALAQDIKTSPVNFYSLFRNTMPTGVEPLYVPVTVAGVKGGKAAVNIGANADEIYVYSIVRAGNKIFGLSVHKLDRGFTNLRIPVSETSENCEITLMTVVDGKVYRSTVRPERREPEKVEIVAETFRDQLVPGAAETWRFRLKKGSGPMPGAAMIATMYNHALDALQNSNWSGGFSFYNNFYYLNIQNPYLRMSAVNVFVPFKSYNYNPITWPAFMFGENTIYIRGRRYMNLMASKTAKMEMFDSAAPESAAANGDMEEEMAESGAAYDSSASLAENPVVSQEPKVEYREAEVLQAFWKPNLVADAEGNVDVEFIVPNANGTWQFRGFGWNKHAEAATYKALSVASKPVMVQPNMPRFLRQGDKATVLATVFNNREEAAGVKTTVEIFRLADNSVIATFTSTDSIPAMGSAVVAADVTAPVSEAAIGYRVRAVSGAFADGEQAAIPILKSASAVIESTEFYLNPNDPKPFEFNVSAPADARLTLQYCQNPIWTVVKAMRGISSNEALTANGIVSQLFSALAASHIVGTNKDIADAIRQWSENPGEKALTSMLEKNETIKKLMLDQTPWVQAAADNSERMAMLAQLLDPENSARAISKGKAKFADYQNGDGGFRWGPWMTESSVWTTENVLITLGIARSLGMLSADFNPMLEKAFTYLQNEAAKPKMPETDEQLALIAAYFPEFRKTVAGERIIRRTVASVISNWKQSGTVDKAYYTFILSANGRRGEAENVMASIRQFAVNKSGMGLCFPNVTDMRGYATIIQAYSAMKASAAEIDALRQYVIVQAQGMDDIGAYNPDYIVAAVLMTGSDWTSVPVKQNVTVNGRPLEIGSVESSAGYFSTTLSETGKVNITVTPNGVTPSYGSVTAVYNQTSRTVKARPGRDLSIEKRFLVERDGLWVETEEFRLGERVRVQLVLKAKRNLEYVSIDDERPAAFEPVDQLPGYVWDGALSFYRENLDASTRLFISYLPAGTYHVTFDMTAAAGGVFTSGIATLQSQYAPELTAHSGGTTVIVKN